VGLAHGLSGCGAGRQSPAGVSRTKANEERSSAPSGTFVADSLWKEANTGTEIELQRLANREGSAGLVSAASRNDEWSIVAVRAMPFTDDALMALAFLCDSARTGTGQYERAVLEALHAIIAEPPRDTEDLASEGIPVCRAHLPSIAARADLEASARDLATSALRMLDERTRPR